MDGWMNKRGKMGGREEGEIYGAKADDDTAMLQLACYKSRMIPVPTTQSTSIGSDHDIDTVIPIPETSRTAASEMMMIIAIQVKRWISEHVKTRWMND